ncbi:MAG: DUF72 domain-containing protein [Bdellovibrionota bacterium]
MATFRVGTAGWSIPKAFLNSFPPEGTHLERYSQVFNAVEINSSFYRHHGTATYAKWAACTPEDFQFSVKFSRIYSHENKLRIDDLDKFKEVLSGVGELGKKLGVLLIQIPPSLQFDSDLTEKFFDKFRNCYAGPLAFELRHSSWFSPEALNLLAAFNIAKVHADPERCHGDFPRADINYFRLHGSPQIYKSSYESDALEEYVQQMKELGESEAPVWCIFDNTAYGFATANALELMEKLGIGKKENAAFLGPRFQQTEGVRT